MSYILLLFEVKDQIILIDKTIVLNVSFPNDSIMALTGTQQHNGPVPHRQIGRKQVGWEQSQHQRINSTWDPDLLGIVGVVDLKQ
jgi:hypothetical protein